MPIIKKPTAKTSVAADRRAEAFIAAAPDARQPALAVRAQRPGRAGRRLQVAFTAQPELLARFDALCASKGINRSAALSLLMARAIEEGI